eukprot:11166146-Prorocentrum_lima.AAC.1
MASEGVAKRGNLLWKSVAVCTRDDGGCGRVWGRMCLSVCWGWWSAWHLRVWQGVAGCGRGWWRVWHGVAGFARHQ